MADLVLSSGFLAFARQAGFLRGVEEAGIEVTGVCGTSSGALAGAMWLAGYDAAAVLHELTSHPPIRYLRPGIGRGLFSLRGLINHLRQRIPSTFDGLPVPFGVGTMGRGKTPVLVTSGDLPTAVAASCAIPWVFQPVRHQGRVLQDGAMTDRLFLEPWKAHRQPDQMVVHVVERTGGVEDEPDLEGHTVVRTPRSGASFFSLGDVQGQFDEARDLSVRMICGQ